MYGKLNNGIIEYAPSRIELGRRIVFNPTATQLESVGYKEIKEGEQPEIKEGFHVIISYEETDSFIIRNYSLEADKEVVKEESSIEKRLSALEASQEEQNATIDTLIFSGLE